MRCPFCSTKDTRVIDSRLTSEGNQVRRRRKCRMCSERFTTYEVASLNMPRIIKTDQTRESFNEQKLRSGIMLALEKRPIATHKIEAMLSQIKKSLLASGKREIYSTQIGELVMDKLRTLDEVAYIRFVSVYRSFNDIKEFRAVVEHLEQKT